MIDEIIDRYLNEGDLSDTPEGRKIWKDGVETGKEWEIQGGRSSKIKEPKNPLPYKTSGVGNDKWNYWNQAFEAGRSLGIKERDKR
jgi:hypothetical protein